MDIELLRTHNRRPITLGSIMEASRPLVEESVPRPIHTGLEFVSTWPGAVAVLRAPVSIVETTIDCEVDVKVVEG